MIETSRDPAAAAADRDSAYRPYVVLAVSGAIGFVLGTTVFATWQVAVESAQVVAGLVKYPADNPFYIYHLQLWTVLHQICAGSVAAAACHSRQPGCPAGWHAHKPPACARAPRKPRPASEVSIRADGSS